MALTAVLVPSLAFAVAETLLAAALLGFGARHRAYRAFAYLLLLRAGTGFCVVMALAVEDPASAAQWTRTLPYLALPVFPATLYFLSSYPRPPPWLPQGWRLGVPFLAAALALEAAYFLDHGLTQFTPGTLFAVGAFAVNNPLIRVGYMLAALVFAVEAVRSEAGPRRSSLLAVSAGFAFFPLVQTLGFFAAGLPARMAADPLWPLHVALYLGVLALAAALVAVLARRARRPDGMRPAALRYLGALGLAGLSTLAALALPVPRGDAFSLLSGLWLLPQPLLCTYALLRLQLFDIDLRLRWTIKQSTVAAAFIGVFFVVSEGAQVVLSESVGPLLGIAAAGMLVFAIAPLQRAAERVATVAMPGVKGSGELSGPERAALYRDQVRFAWADGKLTEDERLILGHLRERLGLSVEEAARLEHEVHARGT